MCINCGGNLIFIEHLEDHEDPALLSPENSIARTEPITAVSFDPSGTNATPSFSDIAPTGSAVTASAGTATGSGDVGYNFPIVSLQTLANFLESGYWGGTNWKWGVSNISYNLTQLTATEATLARQAFHAWSTVANLTFTEVTSGGAIQFVSPATGGAFANFSGSGSTITSANVSISEAWMTSYYNASTPYYNYAFQTYIHEIGHALGLGHQGPYNGSATYDTDNIYANDSWQFSIMSYFAQSQYNYNGAGSSYVWLSGPMQADIVAMQDKYGAPAASLHYYGDNATKGVEYDFASGVRGFTMYSSDGWVGLESSVYGGSQTIDMRAGAFSSVRGYTNNIGNAANTNMNYYGGGSGSEVVDISYYGTYVSTGGGNDYLRSRGTFLGSEVGGYSGNTLDGGDGFDTFIQPNVAKSYVTFQHTSQSSNGWTLSGTNTLEKLTNIELASFTDVAVSLRSDARTDLTKDGASDIVWYNASAGAVNYWDMDNGAVSSWNFAGYVDNTWAARYSADVNGDGNSDIFFRRGSDGAIGFLKNVGGSWSWQGTGIVNSAWDIIAVTDTNNDGIADIVYRNNGLGGATGVYTMNSSGVGTWNGGGFVNTAWTALGSGDTNFDGRSEVIFWNGAIGVTGSYDVNGTWRQIGTAISPNWTVGGVGDIDGNGTHDVLMYNAALGGALGYWKMDYNGNATWTGFSGLGAIGASWTPEAMGDFNNDGDTDILFYNAAAAAAGILSVSNNGLTATWTGLGPVNAAWQIL